MKTRETKQRDLAALTESLQNSKSAMVVSFTKLTVTKDQEFRSSLREAGANYQVVKNTLARIAVKGTQFEDATEHFKGVTAIAWTDNDPVVLSKAISKFMKDNADIYTFKTGVVDGKLLDLKQLTTIANLPSKEELISKLLWVLNSSAERLVTVINAVPRDLAVVNKQIGDAKPGEAPVAEVKAEAPAAAPVQEEAPAADAEVSADAPAADVTPEPEAPVEEANEAPVEAASSEEAIAEQTDAAVDTGTEDILEIAPEAVAEEKAE
jgi:large subunit ribosomal protein L10